MTFTLPPLALTPVSIASTGSRNVVADSQATLSAPGLASHDTAGLLIRMRRSGSDDEELARVISGTAHTAFLGDMRLARKVVSVTSDLTRWEVHAGGVARRRSLVLSVVRNFLAVRGEFGADFLKDLLEAADTGECRALKRDWEDGHFHVAVPTHDKMDRIVRPFARDPSVVLGHLTFRTGAPSTIFLRGLTKDFYAAGSCDASHFRRLLSSFFTLIHEWDHWRQFSGRFEGIEPSSPPLRPSLWNREGDVAELMSHWEEHRLRLRIGDHEVERAAQSRNLTVSQFLLEKINGASTTPWQRLKRALF